MKIERPIKNVYLIYRSSSTAVSLLNLDRKLMDNDKMRIRYLKLFFENEKPPLFVKTVGMFIDQKWL